MVAKPSAVRKEGDNLMFQCWFYSSSEVILQVICPYCMVQADLSVFSLLLTCNMRIRQLERSMYLRILVPFYVLQMIIAEWC